MTPFPEKIETRRLVLRLPADRDIPDIVREIGNWNVCKWLAHVPHPYVARHARQWLAHVRARRVEGRDISYAVTLRSRPDRLIGAIGCQQLGRLQPSIGYWLAERHWGKGYASEAVAAVLAALFVVKPDARPISSAMTENRGSLRVLEKAGFRQQRRRRIHYNLARRRNVKVVWLEWKT